MKILMGTKNPGKIEGARQAFEKYFDSVEIEGISVESEVGNQPVNEEILQGAKNRIKNLKKYANNNNIKADFYIASEAGITNLLGEWIDINAVIIEDRNGFQSFGTSQGFPIPDKYIDEIKETELGKLANSYISQGKLVPDEVTINIVKDRLNWDDTKNGVILDGFPRTIEQAKALDEILKEKGKKVDIVPELVVPDQIIVERILNRATCSNKECGAIYNTKFKPSKVEGICDICGSELVTRTDDTEEAIKTRLEVYRENSKDLIDYYKEKGVLVNITPNDPTADNASEQAVDIILEKAN